MLGLPSETESCLPKSVRSYLWKQKDVNWALGTRNANEARLWFYEHGQYEGEIEEMHVEAKKVLDAMREKMTRKLQGWRMEQLMKEMGRMDLNK